MGPRPLGIRSRPYATINTTDEDYENNHTADTTNNLPPLSPTIYQDDSGLSFEKDNDDDAHDDDEEENHESVATQSLDLQHQLDTAESQTNERCLRLKFVIFLSFLIVMVIFGKEYYNIHGNGSGGTKIISDEFTEEEYKEVRDPTNYHSSSGVRGKSSKPSPPNNESSSTTTSSTGGGEEEEEDKGGICQDDPNFIYKSKSCTKYVGKKIDKAELLQRRCEKGTGIMSSSSSSSSNDAAADAVELLIKDFCKSSCGLCDESSSGILNGDEFTEEEKEIIKEQIEEEVDEGMLEVSEEVDELTTMTEKSNNGDGSDVDDDVLNEDEYVIQDGLEEDEGFLNEEINDIVEKIAEAQADDDGVLAEEKEEYIEELQEELIEDSDMEEEVEELEGELEMVEELKEDLEGVEELGEFIGEEGNDGKDDEEDSLSLGDNDDMPDYFVPLTHKERKEMKGKLRETLLQTKNALRMSASVKNRMAVTDNQRTLTLSLSTPKQFMHMHHMKTGGTSVDGLIRCALNRQKVLHDGTAISYSSMSECGSTVRSCMNTLADKLGATLSNNVFYHNDADGAPIHDAPFDPADETLNIPIDDMNVCKTSETNVMSYCASLHAVRTFGWKEADKITVIRNPIDRAWSMYRFTLKSCYDCQELKNVLKQIYSGTFTSKKSGRDDGDNVVPNFMYEPNNSCAVQLIGHQSTNLLSSVDLYNVANDVRFPREADIVHEAVRNLRQDFTWIGLTDRIQESVEGFRQIFPFLAENLNDAAKAIQEEFQTRGEELEDNKLLLPEGYSDANSCPFEHKNGGHDPTCGTTELDDETKEWIMKLNRRDMAVYKAAVERFELQMEVLQEYNDGNL